MRGDLTTGKNREYLKKWKKVRSVWPEGESPEMRSARQVGRSQTRLL